MYRMRSWSVRNARWLKRAYDVLETLLVLLSPMFRRIGYERLDRPVAAVEKMTKGVLLDSQNCGQCIVGFTGMSCPMNCPKRLRNGPCGGVRVDGSCEVKPGMKCVWVLAWEGNKRFRENGYPIQTVQPAVDNRLVGKSAWLRAVQLRTDQAGEQNA
jgi:hypothetical protein